MLDFSMFNSFLNNDLNGSFFFDFFINSSFNMVDVSCKRIIFRESLAVGEIFVGEEVFFLIKKKLLFKGDVLALAEISGIFGAKKASEILILCHSVFLNKVSLFLLLRESDFSIIVYCFVSSEAKTGVEMEALCGVSISLLTIYDLIKVVTPCIFISDVKLLVKFGGKSFLYINKFCYSRFLFILFFKYVALPFLNLNVAIVSVGSRVKKFNFIDSSGVSLCSLFKKYGAVILSYDVVNDDVLKLRFCLSELVKKFGLQLIVLVGGTGPGFLDVSSAVLRSFYDKEIFGVSEMLRLYSSFYSKFSWLSNTTVGVCNNKLLLAFPGSSFAVFEYFFLLLPILKHLIKLVGK